MRVAPNLRVIEADCCGSADQFADGEAPPVRSVSHEIYPDALGRAPPRRAVRGRAAGAAFGGCSAASAGDGLARTHGDAGE